MHKALPWIYLILAILGAVLPWRANLEFIAESSGNFNIQQFVADASATAAARSLGADLLIGATAVSIWICIEGPKQKNKRVVDRHPVEFWCGLRLWRSLFLIFTRTASPSSRLRIHILSRDIDR